MSYLVANPEDRSSRDEAQIIVYQRLKPETSHLSLFLALKAKDYVPLQNVTCSVPNSTEHS